jgi:hypothetical protein
LENIVKLNRYACRNSATWLKLLILALFWMALPIAAQAQSTLAFPRLTYSEEMSNTGFAIANSNATPATVTYTLYDPIGIASFTATRTIPAGGQVAVLGSDLFPSPGDGGWVMATSPTPYLFGFWLGGDWATYTDGGEAAPGASDLIFPFVAGITEIDFANLRSPFTTVTVRAYGSDGTEVAPSGGIGLFGFQGLRLNVGGGQTYGGVDPAKISYFRITGFWGPAGAPLLAGTSVIRNFLVPTESAVLNAVDATASTTTLNFPHAVSGVLGSSNFVTSVGVINLSPTSQNVLLSFVPDSGAPISVLKAIPGNGAIRDTAQNIFSLPTGFQSGWVQVVAEFPITGFVVYADTAATSGALTAVPVQATPQPSLTFGHIAGAPAWYTGLALLNDTATDASVEVTAKTPDGTQIGSKATFILPSLHKQAKLLSELIPETATQNGGFVSVRTTNGVPLYGVELFGSPTGVILADVASGVALDCAKPTSGPTSHSGSINTETWTADKSPHMIPFDMTINGTVTIEPCAEVLLGKQVTVSVAGTGNLVADGTATKPIHIGPSVAGSAFAKIRAFSGGTIHMSNVNVDGGGDPQNTLPYLTGTFDVQGADQTQPTQPTLFVDHVLIRDSKSDGIVLRDGAGFAPGSTNLTVTGSLQYPVGIWSRAVGSLPTGKYLGNGTDEILLPATSGNEAIYESTTMHDRGVPYRVGHPTSTGLLRVDVVPNGKTPSTLTIEPGVVLRFKKGGMMSVTTAVGTSPALGSLVAAGTAAKPIIFTSAETPQAAGDWLGIWFGLQPSAVNKIDYARIEYAGGASSSGSDSCNPVPIGKQNDAAIRIFGVPAQGQFVTNTTIANSANHGIDRGWRNDFKPSFLPTNTFIGIGRCTETYPKDTNGACPMTVPCPVP